MKPIVVLTVIFFTHLFGMQLANADEQDKDVKEAYDQMEKACKKNIGTTEGVQNLVSSNSKIFNITDDEVKKLLPSDSGSWGGIPGLDGPKRCRMQISNYIDRTNHAKEMEEIRASIKSKNEKFDYVSSASEVFGFDPKYLKLHPEGPKKAAFELLFKSQSPKFNKVHIKERSYADEKAYRTAAEEYRKAVVDNCKNGEALATAVDNKLNLASEENVKSLNQNTDNCRTYVFQFADFKTLPKPSNNDGYMKVSNPGRGL